MRLSFSRIRNPDTPSVGIANSDEQRICNALNSTAQNRTTSMSNNPFSPT